MKVELPLILSIIGEEGIESHEGFISLTFEQFELIEQRIKEAEEKMQAIDELIDKDEDIDKLEIVKEIKAVITPQFILVRDFGAVESGTGLCIPNESLPKIKEFIPDYMKEGFPSSVFGKEGYPMINGLKYYDSNRLQVLFKIINDKLDK